TTFAQRGRLGAQVVDPVDQDRPLALEVVREENVRRLFGQLEHGHPGAHSLDREHQLRSERIDEELRVPGYVVTRRVQVLELLKWGHMSLAMPKKQPRCSPSCIVR